MPGAKSGETPAAKASEPPRPGVPGPPAPAAKEATPGPAPAAAKPAPAVAKPAAVPPAAAKPAVKMPPLKGSHVKDDDNTCLQCHTNALDPKDKDQARFCIIMDGLKKDVHYQKGVNCIDCHGGDGTILETKAHQTDDFRAKLPEIQKFCAHCHEKAVALLNASPHKVAIDGVIDPTGTTPKVSCLDCHANADGAPAGHPVLRVGVRGRFLRTAFLPACGRN